MNTKERETRDRLIVAMRKSGSDYASIAKAFGVHYNTVWRVCSTYSVPRPARFSTIRTTVPVGTLAMHRMFSFDELLVLNRARAKWGYDTVAEAVVDIARDFIAEQQAKEAKDVGGSAEADQARGPDHSAGRKADGERHAGA
jgi:hypothetical protein